MAIQRIDLLNHNFSRSIRGYAPDEVDEFLQDIADTMARLSDERVRLLDHVQELEERLSDYMRQEKALRETLISSQRLAEDIKDAAQKEALVIIETAQAKAEGIIYHGNVRLMKVMEQVSEARTLKAQLEYKVRSVIEGHLRLLEEGQKEDLRMEKALAHLSGLPEDKTSLPE